MKRSYMIEHMQIEKEKQMTLQKRVNNQLNTTEKKSLLSRVKSYNQTPLLIDVSGSMCEQVAEGTKWDIVNSILEEFKDQRIFEFSTFCKPVDANRGISRPYGSTNIAGAFNYLKDREINHFILVTDGMPDNPASALDTSSGLSIDIIYIGPQPMPQFLMDLARGTSGNFVDVNMLRTGAKAELENKIKGFLNA